MHYQTWIQKGSITMSVTLYLQMMIASSPPAPVFNRLPLRSPPHLYSPAILLKGEPLPHQEVYLFLPQIPRLQ